VQRFSRTTDADVLNGRSPQMDIATPSCRTHDFGRLQINSSCLAARMHFHVLFLRYQWRSQGFQSGGLRGRVREGCFPPAGGPGAVPLENFLNYKCTQVSFSAFSDKNLHIDACKLWKIFQITDARRRVLAHFSDKVNTLIPAFIPVNFGKVPNPFDF
jgi:hypothetical protein